MNFKIDKLVLILMLIDYVLAFDRVIDHRSIEYVGADSSSINGSYVTYKQHFIKWLNKICLLIDEI